MWGTEVADGCTQGVFEGCVAAGEFFADAGGGLPGQPGVGHGVVADEVAGCGDGSGKVGTLADEATDEEEGGADLVAGEDFEEAFGGGGVGTVVVGEGDLVGIGARSEDFAEDLGVRPEGGVGGCSGEKSGCCEDGGGFGDGLGCGHGLIEGSNARSLRGYPPRVPWG